MDEESANTMIFITREEHSVMRDAVQINGGAGHVPTVDEFDYEWAEFGSTSSIPR